MVEITQPSDTAVFPRYDWPVVWSNVSVVPYRGWPFDEEYFNSGRGYGYSHYNQTINAYLDIVIDDIHYELSRFGTDIFTDGTLRALDIGCATGLHVDALNQRGLVTDGLDISSYAIGEAQSAFPSYTFYNEDILNNTIPDDTYDIIIALGLTGCLPNKNTVNSQFLAEIDRITKPGWRAYLTLNTTHRVYLSHTQTDVDDIGTIVTSGGKTIYILNLRDSGIADDDERTARTFIGSYGWKVVIY